MEKLVNLIESLKPGEIQLIQDFYTARKNRGEHQDKKQQLFQLIITGQVKSNEEAAKMLYKQKPDSSLCRLKKKLQKDILDVVTLSYFTKTHEDVLDEELECHKSLLQGKILISRGLFDQGISILKKVSQMAEEYEFPNIKLASDDILRTYVGLRSGFNTYTFYNKSIQHSFEVYEKLLDAKANYLTIIPKVFDNEQSLDIKCSQAMKPSILEKLEKSCKSSDSKKVKYWYHMMTIQFYLKQKVYEKAKEHAGMVHHLLNHDPAKFTNREKAQLYIELSKISIHLKEYKMAVNYAERAIKYYDSSTLDFLYALQILFFAYFRRGDYGQALDVIELALGHRHMDAIKMQRAMWSIFKAAVFFKQGEYKRSNHILLSQDQWPKERSLWLLGSKLLELINILELQDYDWFEFKLESFRKLISHFNKEHVKRYKLIHHILRALLKYCGDFTLAAFQEKNSLSLLDQEEGELGWDPLGYEVVSISGWFAQKLH